MSVRGRLSARDLGVTLTHEHALANFQPYEEWVAGTANLRSRGGRAAVLPHLQRIAALGCRSFVDATAVGSGAIPPAGRLSKEAGCTSSPSRETTPRSTKVFFRNMCATSLEALRTLGTGVQARHRGHRVRPGFIKLGFNGGALSEVERKLIRAARRRTSPPGSRSARIPGRPWRPTSMAELEAAGVHPSAWIWIHAQEEPDPREYYDAARRGAWISLDGVSPRASTSTRIASHCLRDLGLLHRVLVSQDAGWYSVGEPDGGKFRPYDTVFTEFIPALKARGFSSGRDRADIRDEPCSGLRGTACVPVKSAPVAPVAQWIERPPPKR